MPEDMNEFVNAIKEALEFKGLEPSKVETNCGGVWFVDKNSGKTHYILIDECTN